MSSVANDAPIYQLSYDLLLHIFEDNAHMFADDSALITTLAASQVCQHWRSFMLATPSLWGKLLDFDVLDRSTGEGYWGEELVRRTGSSVLWIKAVKGLVKERPNQQLALHFIKTIKDHFHRVEILVVDLELMEFARHREFWNEITSHPVPQLQCFDYTVILDRDGRRNIVQRASYSPFPLFADDAPRLRTFRAIQFEFDLQVPWARGLRDLLVGQSTFLPTLLDALPAIESLERLELNNIVWLAEGEDNVYLQTVHLPKLKELRLGSLHPSVCDILLDHLIIPPDCALRYTLQLSTVWFLDRNLETEITTIIRRLSEYARRYFLHWVPTNLLLRCEKDVLCIATGTQDGLGGFYLLIESDLLHVRAQITATFLSEFTLPEFRHVTQLRFETEFSDEDVLLLAFFGCLSSVQILTTCCWHPHFFNFLKEKLDPQRSVFPSLKTIKLEKSKPRPGLPIEDYKNVDLSDFIGSHDGYPVEVVISP
ncbi:hypothetical protein HYPSUDRAFT_45984 [Hypholoma sublateritium FD-334 SS-4]|uniref:Uncharacterized protein n=1 Tax=Hypholoma sublateritium (strain FD-334 SS-4) TaxID=945553 RepID=A0A0D2M3P4_HYPSF|nr:hypothetical protein HYPSUDRAFT_45984 [Hypholoma sublateritium FD-334 SS-4]